MARDSGFEFISVDDEAELGGSATYVAIVPAGLRDSPSLLIALQGVLQLPGYFGLNWNALFDCLRDLHWMNQRTVVILHRDVPNIPQSELIVYIDLLAESARSWLPGEAHNLRVIFPAASQAEVSSVLASADS